MNPTEIGVRVLYPLATNLRRRSRLCRNSFNSGQQNRRVSHSPFFISLARREVMNSPVIKVGQLGINYVVDGASTSSLGAFELTVPPGSNVPPPHSHSNNEEFVYVLEGTLRYTVGHETRDLSVGQSMSTPKGVVHAFGNPFNTTA